MFCCDCRRQGERLAFEFVSKRSTTRAIGAGRALEAQSVCSADINAGQELPRACETEQSSGSGLVIWCFRRAVCTAPPPPRFSQTPADPGVPVLPLGGLGATNLPGGTEGGNRNQPILSLGLSLLPSPRNCPTPCYHSVCAMGQRPG